VQLAVHARELCRERVSILTRPEGRVQRVSVANLELAIIRFNPHPSRRTGATCRQRLTQPARIVSILTRPEGRVQREFVDISGRAFPVSILTRPEGRVQPERPHARTAPRTISFQSSPVPKDGCNMLQTSGI